MFKSIKNNDIDDFKKRVELNPNVLCQTDPHGFTPLMFSLHNNKRTFALFCLKYGHQNALTKRDWSGRQSTALHFAATKGYFDVVSNIIKLGHNIKDYDGFGHSASSLAYKNGHKNIGQFLDGLWYKCKWSPITHLYCPPEFQTEVKTFLLTLKHLELNYQAPKIYKDIKHIIINKLLDHHKRTFYSFKCL